VDPAVAAPANLGAIGGAVVDADVRHLEAGEEEPAGPVRVLEAATTAMVETLRGELVRAIRVQDALDDLRHDRERRLPRHHLQVASDP
jgi:hypothetical protein